MAEVQSFSRKMIQNYLDSTDLRYLINREGDFIIEFAYDAEIDAELTFSLLAGGTNNQIYVITCHSNKRYGREEWPRIVYLCNRWNAERRWPKAYLYVKDPKVDQEGVILLEEQLDLEKGVHQELLSDFTETVISAGSKFWIWFKDYGVRGL